MDEVESMLAEFKREHPWTWRKARLRGKWQQFVGKRLPFLCRHTATMGPAGAGHGTCMDCGRKVLYEDD